MRRSPSSTLGTRLPEPPTVLDVEAAGERPYPRLTEAMIAGSLAVSCYAVDAWVVQPDPGTSPSTGLIRLVLLGATWVVLRAVWLTAGWTGRSILGSLIGVSTIVVVGAIAVMSVADGHVGSREVLGAIAFLGGIVMAVSGVVVWARRVLLRDGSKSRLRLLWLIPILFVMVQFTMLPGLLALYATNAPRPVGGSATPADLGSAYHDVTLVASDGVRIAGWWIPSRNGAAVIALAGSGSTKDDVLAHADLLIEHGYGVLLYDARGHGSSQGRIMEFGWNTAPDVSSAVDFVLAQSSVTSGVSVLGLSMGGETAITAAAADPRIRSVIAEGVTDRTFADVTELGADLIALATSWETFALVDLLVPQGPPIPLVDAFRGVAVPVLLIEGEAAKEQAAGEAYLAAGNEVTLWSLPDTPHISAIRIHPRRYEQRLIAFLGAAM
jgi:fermentation-respiration switch protein FrsA (DUF1100 family)